MCAYWQDNDNMHASYYYALHSVPQILQNLYIWYRSPNIILVTFTSEYHQLPGHGSLLSTINPISKMYAFKLNSCCDALWPQKCGLPLTQVMAYCLTCHIMPKPILTSHQCDSVAFSWRRFTANFQVTIFYNELENLLLKITATSPEGQWFRKTWRWL